MNKTGIADDKCSNACFVIQHDYLVIEDDVIDRVSLRIRLPIVCVPRYKEQLTEY